MKKFTKGMLIAAGIFGAVGIGLTAAGGVMGASMSELTGVKSLKRVLLVADGDYDYDDSDDYDDDDDYDDYDYDYDDSDDYDSDDYDDSDDCDDSEDYARAVDENEEDSTVYQLKYQPTKLDIELKYDELILEEGDSFCVRVYDDSGKNVTVKESSDTLKVRSTIVTKTTCHLLGFMRKEMNAIAICSNIYSLLSITGYVGNDITA